MLLVAMYLMTSESSAGDYYVGTGFFYNSRGDVMTNRHVVQGCSKIGIQLPNKKVVSGSIIAKSSVFDIAAIRTNTQTKRFAALPVQNKYPIIPAGGADVFTYGYSIAKRGLDGWPIAGLIIDEPRIEKKY